MNYWLTICSGLFKFYLSRKKKKNASFDAFYSSFFFSAFSASTTISG